MRCLFTVTSGLVITWLVVACKLLPIEPMPAPPDEWKIAASGKENRESCEGIAGLYESSSAAIRYRENSWEPIRSYDMAYFPLFVGPASAAQVSSSQIDKSESKGKDVANNKWFAMLFPGREKLQIQTPDKSGDKVALLTWSQEEGEFTCSDGTITFPVQIDLGGGEGPDGNSQRQISVGVSSEHDLLVYELISLAKPSIRTRDFPLYTVYRFARLEEQAH